MFRKSPFAESAVEPPNCQTQDHLPALPNAVLDSPDLVLMSAGRGVRAMRTQAIGPRTSDVNDHFLVPDFPGINPYILQSQELFDILFHRGGGDLVNKPLNPTTSLVFHHTVYYRA